jgi:serine/threonine protein kinase
MGEVYKAGDGRLDRTVAIKVMPPHVAADPQFRARFDREARAVSQRQHPHICTLYDVGEVDGTSFLVVELLQGQTLAERLIRGYPPRVLWSGTLRGSTRCAAVRDQRVVRYSSDPIVIPTWTERLTKR